MVTFANDRYPDTTYGLRNNHNIEIGPNVSWQITPALNAHGYYTFQQIYYDQASLYTSGTNFGPSGSGYDVPWGGENDGLGAHRGCLAGVPGHQGRAED